MKWLHIFAVVAVIGGLIAGAIRVYKNRANLVVDDSENLNFGSSNFNTFTNIDTGPTTNIDGTPMVGGVDINGNPYGVTR